MKILVVGVSVRAMVESAVSSRYRVVALDAFGDQDLRAMAESYSLPRDFGIPYSASALYEASRKLAFDAVVYTSGLENHPKILDRFAGNCSVIGNSPEAVRSVRNWPDLFSRLRRAGFSVPETIFPGDGHDFDFSRRWLIKPLLSGGGHGISLLEEKAFPGERQMLQQYIPGKPCSASFVANDDESVVIGIAEQLIGMPQFGVCRFRYCGNILPLPEMLCPDTSRTILEQVRRTARFLAREYHLTGVNGFDFILDGDQVWLTEVNPRYSASMELIERAYGLSVFHLHVQAAVDKRIPEFELESALNGAKFFGKSILFCERDCAAPELQDWRSRDLRDIPVPGGKIRRGNPICTILTSGSNYNETLAGLIRQARMLREHING